MKKLKYLLFGIILFFITNVVYAIPQYSVSVSKKSIQVGQSVTVTVTVSNTASWDVKITSAGSTNGCSNHWADATADANNVKKSFTTTCKGTSVGTISFIVGGDITDADGNNHELSEKVTVNVTEAVVNELSTVNSLSSLAVDNAELVPVFDPNVLEYSVNMPAGTKSAYIRIVKKDSRSSASGWGDVNLEEGANRFEVKVKAENGNVKTYVVVINVEPEEALTVTIEGKEYVVIRNKKSLEIPKGFTDTIVHINDKDVPAFYYEKTNTTIVGLKDSDGNTSYFIYDEGSKKFTLFDLITVKGVMFIVMNPDKFIDGYDNKKNITLGEKEYATYYKDNSDLVLIYGLNLETNNTGWYQYDVKEDTLQRFVETKVEEKKENDYLLVTILFAIGLGLAILVLLVLLASNASKDKKNKKLVAMIEKKMEDEKIVPKKEEQSAAKKILGRRKKAVEVEEEDEKTRQMNMKFLEFIDQEAEKSRALSETPEEVIEPLNAEEKPAEKKLSSKEYRAIMKAKKKAEKEEARKMREEFLATREVPTVNLENTGNINTNKKKNKNKKK